MCKQDVPFTTDMPIVHVPLITDTILSENIDMSSPIVGIDSQSNLSIHVATSKENAVALCISCKTSCLMHIFLYLTVLLFPPLILILFQVYFRSQVKSRMASSNGR